MTASPAPTPAPALPQVRVGVSVPFQNSNAYPVRRMDGLLSPTQAETCIMILDALRQNRAKHTDGRTVATRPLDVFRWFLDRSREEIAKAPGARTKFRGVSPEVS